MPHYNQLDQYGRNRRNSAYDDAAARTFGSVDDIFNGDSPLSAASIAIAADDAGSVAKASLEDTLLHYLLHPVDWVEDVLGANPFQWQRDVLVDLEAKRYVSIRSGHGVGKTACLAWAINWFLVTHPNSKIVCTANTKDQLLDVLWPECHKWIDKSKQLSQIVTWKADRIEVNSNPAEWFAAARTAEVKKLGKTGLVAAEALQGRHAEALLLVIDEASGVDEAILSSLEGALTSDHSYVIMAGNPTRVEGSFFDSFHKNRHLWSTFHINSETSENVDPKYPARMLEIYGSRDHPVYLVKVRGEFPPASPNSLFTLAMWENAQIAPLVASEYDAYEFGVDVARFGDNESVIVVKRGPVIEEIIPFTHSTTMETAGRVIQCINKFRPISVKIDEPGVGGGVIDRLQELNYKECIAVNGASKPIDDKRFVNLRDETYWNLRDMLEKVRLKVPKDDQLFRQALEITWKVMSNGKIKIETKDEMRRRNVKSPDRLDAIVLACMPAISMRSAPARWGTIPFMAR